MFEDLTQSLDDLLNQIDENKALSSTIGLFLVLYAGLAAPKLPRVLAELFDNSAFRLVILFLIAYTASRDSGVAIVATVALLMSFQTLTMYKTNDVIVSTLNKNVPVEIPEVTESETESVLPEASNMDDIKKLTPVESEKEPEKVPKKAPEKATHKMKVSANDNRSIYSSSPEKVSGIIKGHSEPELQVPKVNNSCAMKSNVTGFFDDNNALVIKPGVTGYSEENDSSVVKSNVKGIANDNYPMY